MDTAARDVAPLDQDGHLSDYRLWSIDIAHQLALTLPCELTDWHIALLVKVRDFYIQHGYAPTTRPLIKYLQRHYDQQVDSQLLMQRFNTGLIARHINRLAGLPKPANCL